jgi:drug/metabolite transporter (DMT)-like permease
MNFKQLLKIFMLACLWGPSFLLIKLALENVGPFTLVTLRVGIAGLVLLMILLIKFRTLEFTRNWKLGIRCFVLGFLSNGLPFLAISYSLAHIPSSLSALINGMVPIITMLLASIFLKDEKLTWCKGIGVLLGFSGFVIIFLPTLLSEPLELEPVGIWLGLLASCSYAVGLIYGRQVIRNTQPLIVSTLQLLTALIYLIPLAWYLEGPDNLILNSYLTWGYILGLAVLGTAIAFILYYHIMSQYGAVTLSMTTYLLPLIATVLGIFILKETITARFWVAACLILGGVLVVNRRQSLQ